LRLPLSVIGGGRRAASLLLLLLLRWRLSVCALHSLSGAACFTRGSATGRGRDRLSTYRRLTSAALRLFTCGHGRRRAEPLTLLLTLRRILFRFTLPRAWLLAWSPCRLATKILLLRRCTFKSCWRGRFHRFGCATCCTRLW